MTLFVDTSVWSLALRRDGDAPAATAGDAVGPVGALREALLGGDEVVVTTGLVLQELLQGFAGPRDRAAIVERFAALPMVAPDRRDHVDAAGLRNACRSKGVRLGTIDALLAQLCIRHRLRMLTTDLDFVHAARHCPLRLWAA